jgi:prevent-host-death family protein
VTRLTASSVRDAFAATLDRVAEGGERIVLDRHGKSVAALVPIKDLELLRELEDRLDNEAATRAGTEQGRIDWSALKRDLDL